MMSKTRIRVYLRHPLRKLAYDRMSYWHEAAAMGLAFGLRWHPEFERQQAKYYTWRDRWKRFGGGKA